MQVSLYGILKQSFPRAWWLAFVPSLLLYGGLIAIAVGWYNYHSALQKLDVREAQAKQKQEELLRAEQYKARLEAELRAQSSYQVLNAVDQKQLL